MLKQKALTLNKASLLVLLPLMPLAQWQQKFPMPELPLPALLNGRRGQGSSHWRCQHCLDPAGTLVLMQKQVYILSSPQNAALIPKAQLLASEPFSNIHGES